MKFCRSTTVHHSARTVSIGPGVHVELMDEVPHSLQVSAASGPAGLKTSEAGRGEGGFGLCWRSFFPTVMG